MLGTYFYHSSIRKVTVAVGDLFNNIHVQKLEDDGITVAHDITVPIALSRRMKFLAKLRGDTRKDTDPTTRASTQIILPRLTYDIEAIDLDASRQKNRMEACILQSVDGQGNEIFSRMRNPIPYTISYNLTAWTNNMDEMLQISEQILPFFAPDFNLTVTMVPELGWDQKVKLEYGGLTMNDEFEGDFDSFNKYQWTFAFTADMHIFPPVAEVDIIRKAIVNMRKEDTNYSYQKITVEVDPIDAKQNEVWTEKVTVEEDVYD
jgi:hypothetical protein